MAGHVGRFPQKEDVDSETHSVAQQSSEESEYPNPFPADLDSGRTMFTELVGSLAWAMHVVQPGAAETEQS